MGRYRFLCFALINFVDVGGRITLIKYGEGANWELRNYTIRVSDLKQTYKRWMHFGIIICDAIKTNENS